MGVSVRFGAVNHSRSHGLEKRFKGTMLVTLQKVMLKSGDWAEHMGWVCHCYAQRVT